MPHVTWRMILAVVVTRGCTRVITACLHLITATARFAAPRNTEADS